ncbi:MAG: PsbP-related protein [Sciscionella sp.]
MTDADEDKKSPKSDAPAADVDEEVAEKDSDEGFDKSDSGKSADQSDEGSSSRRNRLSRQTRIRLLGVAGVVVLGVGAALLAVELGQNSVASTTASGQPSGSGTQSQLRQFRDEKAGFTLSYPSDWQQFPTTDPQVKLLAVGGKQDSFQARVIDLDFPVSAKKLPSVKPLTDRLVAENKTATLLAKPQPVELNGVPGYFYFYTFKDPQSGKTGVHSHFFLFNGTKMISLVFQAVPKEAFPPVASTFDDITQSFRLLKK